MDFKYPYTDYHELNLDWFLSEFKNLVETWARTQQDWISMQEYIRDYFTNLNVQTEIDNKINAMILDGTFGAIVEPFVTAALPALVHGELPDVVAAQIAGVVAAQIDGVVAEQLPAIAAQAAADEVSTWLAAHIDPDTGYVIDDSLTVSNAAADAKAAGDRITDFIANFFSSYDNNMLFGRLLTRGAFYNTNGAYTVNADYGYFPLIAVEAGVHYTAYNCGTAFLCWYDADSNFISGHNITHGNDRQAPATAAYMRLSVFKNYFNTVVLCKYGENYTAYGKYLFDRLSGSHAFGVEKNQLFNTYLDIDDMNDAVANRVYIMQLTSSSTMSNLPDNFEKRGLAFLYTYQANYTSSNNQIFQYLERISSGQRWIRNYNSTTSTWSEWSERLYKSVDSIDIHIGAGQPYTTMKTGMTAAYALNNAKVIVHPGIYDLVTEFTDDISGTMGKTGLPLGKGMHVYFMEGAKVTANFDNTGGTYDATTWRRIYDYFNPFYAGDGDYVLENADIEAANTRYCVHDELQGSGIYSHIYKNCKMKYVNNHSDINYVQCIGGGLGEKGYIEIDGGIYECSTDYGIASVGGDPANSQQVISYHNGNNANAKSSIFVKDVYIKNRGYMRFSSYGSSTSMTEVNISSCGSGLPVLIKPEAGYTTINVAANDFCNEKRNPYHWVVSGTSATLVAD